MRRNVSSRLALACAAIWTLALAGCAPKQTVVDDAALRAADGDTADWLTYGRTYSEQRFSPLKQIDEQSVGRLGLAWSYDIETLRARGGDAARERRRDVCDQPWSVVYAFDAKTGKLLWNYDPKVPKDHAKYVCCDVVNRGVALYKGHVFVGTLDGRLISLDAKTGVRVGSANDAEGRELRHHRRAAHREGAGADRKRGSGVPRARLRFRIRRGDRQTCLADIYGAGRSLETI